jgi:hypothetical protein
LAITELLSRWRWGPCAVDIVIYLILWYGACLFRQGGRGDPFGSLLWICEISCVRALFFFFFFFFFFLCAWGYVHLGPYLFFGYHRILCAMLRCFTLPPLLVWCVCLCHDPLLFLFSSFVTVARGGTGERLGTIPAVWPTIHAFAQPNNSPLPPPFIHAILLILILMLLLLLLLLFIIIFDTSRPVCPH